MQCWPRRAKRSTSCGVPRGPTAHCPSPAARRSRGRRGGRGQCADLPDARRAGRRCHKAAVKITVAGDTDKVVPVPGFTRMSCSGDVFCANATSVRNSPQIESGDQLIRAKCLPHQPFASVDVRHGGIGSQTGPTGVEPGYPALLDRGSAQGRTLTKRATAGPGRSGQVPKFRAVVTRRTQWIGETRDFTISEELPKDLPPSGG
jgi:hypothetical protein